MKEKDNLDDLLKEALENARQDRETTKEAFEKMRNALNVENQENVQVTMLVGEKAVKLLEQMTRSNQQIVAVAQIKEKREGRKVNSNDKLSMEDVVQMAQEEGIDLEN